MHNGLEPAARRPRDHILTSVARRFSHHGSRPQGHKPAASAGDQAQNKTYPRPGEAFQSSAGATATSPDGLIIGWVR